MWQSVDDMEAKGDDIGDGSSLAKSEEKEETSSSNVEEDRSSQNTQPLFGSENDSSSQEFGIEVRRNR
jgi:hypothetical protein